MTTPQFFITPGYGKRQLEHHHYSQAVRIGNRIETSGQGGWNDDFEFPDSLEEEIKQAFINVGRTLQAAGTDWQHVIHINSYHVDFKPNVNAIMSNLFRHYMPKHAPIWTLLGVACLGEPKMRVEIRATAIIPD